MWPVTATNARRTKVDEVKQYGDKRKRHNGRVPARMDLGDQGRRLTPTPKGRQNKAKNRPAALLALPGWSLSNASTQAGGCLSNLDSYAWYSLSHLSMSIRPKCFLSS